MSRAEARRWLHGMLSWLVMLACADATAPVAQPCYPATKPKQLLSLSQVSFHRSTHSHLISSVATTSISQQARQAASGRPHDGLGSRCVHRSLTQIRAASVRDPCRHTGHENEAAWRSVLWFYRPPAATPLSLSPNGHFQPPRLPAPVDPGGYWLVLGVPSTGTAYGAIGGAMETHGDLWYW